MIDSFTSFLPVRFSYCLVLAVFFCLVGAASAQPPNHDTLNSNRPRIDTTRIDSSKIDSTKKDSTLARRDTLQRIIPIPFVGSIDPSLPPLSVITDTEQNFMDYENAGDLLLMQNGVFFHDPGSPGQFKGLTIDGVEQHSIAVLADGIPLREPLSGAFDLNLYPTEAASRIEFISGTRAFLYGFNGTGGAINFVSKNNKAIHASSRIRYSQGAYGYSMFDGMVSQDVLRGMNVTAGAEHTTTGGRFVNSKDDLWSGRFKLRYNFNNRLNAFGSETYYQTYLQLNGGIADTVPFNSRFNPQLTDVVNPDSYEKVTRHDLQAGVASRLLGDTTLISTLTFYYSTNLREYRAPRPPELENDPTRVIDNLTQWYGARFTHTLTFGRQQIDAGAEFERSGVVASPIAGQRFDSRVAAFGKTATSFLHPVSIAAYARVDQYLGTTGLSFGADGNLAPDSLFELFGGFSHAYRYPSYEERFWNDTILAGTTSRIPEKHDLFEAGIRSYHPASISGELKLFHRTIHDAYVLLPQGTGYRVGTISQRTLRGASGSLSFRLGVFYMEGTGQYLTVNDSSEALLPEFSGMGGLYFWNELVGGHLNLKAGVRGRLIASYPAPGYNSEIQRFLPEHSTTSQTTGVLDVVVIAKLGDAYIHLIIDNIFDRQYIVTSFYPMPDEQLRLGVSWDFEN